MAGMAALDSQEDLTCVKFVYKIRMGFQTNCKETRNLESLSWMKAEGPSLTIQQPRAHLSDFARLSPVKEDGSNFQSPISPRKTSF